MRILTCLVCCIGGCLGDWGPYSVARSASRGIRWVPCFWLFPGSGFYHGDGLKGVRTAVVCFVCFFEDRGEIPWSMLWPPCVVCVSNRWAGVDRRSVGSWVVVWPWESCSQPEWPMAGLRRAPSAACPCLADIVRFKGSTCGSRR